MTTPHDPLAPATERFDPPGAARLTAGLAMLTLPVVLAHGAVDRAAGLRELALGGSPYWVPERGLLLYLVLPAVVLAAGVLFLAPGLLVAAALGRAQRPWRWFLDGFLLALLVNSATAALFGAVAPAPTRLTFAALQLALLSASGGLLYWRARRSTLPAPPSGAFLRAAWMAVPPILLLVALAPKFLWEDFNGDGAHAFEAARLTLLRPLPFWTTEHGDVAGFPGLTSVLFLYPTGWFVRLFGELEAAARLPYLLHLALFFAGAMYAIEEGAGRRLAAEERIALWLALLAGAVTLGFSATYSPHNADFALPATQDTMVVTTFVGFAIAALAGEWRWAAAWAAATWLTAPNGPLLLMLFAPAAFLAQRPVRWRTIAATAAVVCLCALAARSLTWFLDVTGHPPPGGEYAGDSLARRFRFLILTDWRRFLFALVPAGITTWASLGLWRRLDPRARTLLAVALGSFALFYVQAGVALHHFVPAMLLPVIAFWRWRAASGPSSAWTLAAVAGALLAIFLSCPVDPRPRMAAQRVSRTISERSAGYDDLAPEPFRRMHLLLELYPSSASPLVPDESYGGSPLVWLHYARHEGPGDAVDRGVNALLMGPEDPAPRGFDLLARDTDGALWLRDPALLTAQRQIRQPTPPGSELYEIPRVLLFRQGNAALDSRIIDLGALGRRILGE